MVLFVCCIMGGPYFFKVHEACVQGNYRFELKILTIFSTCVY